MNRDITEDLMAWRDDPERMPLLLRGARQVGKSYVIEAFGRKAFKHMVVVNFDLQPELATCFESLYPVDILRRLQIATGEKLVPGVSLLFLDEIQICPQAIQALRYFKEQMPALHVVGAGSLLEFTLNDADFSMPVGRIQSLYLKPLSFREYLNALGQEVLVAHLDEVTLAKPPDLIAHEKLLRLIKEYCVLGGMPAVVKSYLRYQDIERCQRMQSVLLNTYRNDFGKYSKASQHPHLKALFERVPGLVAERFKYSKVDPETKSRDLKAALGLLRDAGLVYTVYSSAASGVPLNALINEKQFKVLFLDVGLVNYVGKLDGQLILEDDLLLVNRGAIAEQFVGQELLAYQPMHEEASLFFWARDQRNSQAEVDFLMSLGSEVFPVEVKAGVTGQLRSLQMFLAEKPSRFGLHISQRPLALDKRRGILSVPLYLISQLPRLVKEL